MLSRFANLPTAERGRGLEVVSQSTELSITKVDNVPERLTRFATIGSTIAACYLNTKWLSNVSGSRNAERPASRLLEKSVVPESRSPRVIFTSRWRSSVETERAEAWGSEESGGKRRGGLIIKSNRDTSATRRDHKLSPNGSSYETSHRSTGVKTGAFVSGYNGGP